MKRIGLALSDGGVRGAALVPFLQVFDDLRIKPAVIAGCSSGAFLGALYASGVSGAELEEMLLDLHAPELIELIDFSRRPAKGLLKGEQIARRFQEILKASTFSDLPIPLCVVATDFWARRQAVLREGSITQAVRASISTPGVFVPAVVNGRVLVDGGAVNPLPYDLIRDECDAVVAIDVSQPEAVGDGGQIPGIIDCIATSLMISEKALIERKLRDDPPEIYVRLELGDAGVLEFGRLREVLELGKKQVGGFERRLRELAENTDARASGG